MFQGIEHSQLPQELKAKGSLDLPILSLQRKYRSQCLRKMGICHIWKQISIERKRTDWQRLESFCFKRMSGFLQSLGSMGLINTHPGTNTGKWHGWSLDRVHEICFFSALGFISLSLGSPGDLYRALLLLYHSKEISSVPAAAFLSFTGIKIQAVFIPTITQHTEDLNLL